MATLNNTYGATLRVSNSTVPYSGAGVNQFFGGNAGDWIAMLRYGAPSALGANEVITAASFIGMFKADTAWDSADVTIGLIDAGWTTSTTDFATLYSYITGVNQTAYIAANGTDTQLTLAITSLLQTWAASPSLYSGIYFRCNSMELSRIGASGQSISTIVETRTAGTPPPSVWLDAAMVAPGSAVNLNWSGQGAGYLNPTVGYKIGRSENGGAWNDSWATAASSPFAVTAHATYGNYYSYRIITDGHYIDSAESMATATLTSSTATSCGAPTSVFFTWGLTVSEDPPTLNYSGALPGTLNTITGYEIEYATSADGATFGAWTALKTVGNTGTSGATFVYLPAVRGQFRKYRIRTQGSAGTTYYSAWKESPAIRYNSIPTAPTVFVASPTVFISGSIALAYSGATDDDGNISTYNVQYATSADGINWSGWTSLADGTTSHAPTLSAGHYIKYQVRTVDYFAVVSGWKESNICSKNTAPSAPVITYPQNSKTIYNSRPRFLLTIGADPESHAQSIAAGGYTASTANQLAGSAKTILRRATAASAGTVSISAMSTDLYAESSSAAARDTTYAVPSFTDAIVKGTTPIKAAHITELRTMIDTVRAYYGLAAVSWAEAIIAGITKSRNWAAHVVEMQAAINDIVALINVWDTASTVNRVMLPAWLAPGAKPSTAIMEQIRAAIPLL